MQSEIFELASMLKDIVHAIHSVLGVEVTIVDRHLVRAAATGLYEHEVGRKIASGSVFEKSVHSGLPYIVETPGEDDLCLSCQDREQCRESAEVCSPILVEGTVVGVIGLIAFNSVDKMKLLENRSSLLDFLEKMGKLIASKVAENRKAKELEVLINSVETPILSILTDGRIVGVNDAVRRLIDAKADYATVDALLGAGVLSAIQKGRFQLEAGLKKRFSVTVHPVTHADKTVRYVLQLSPLKEVIREFNRLFSKQQPTPFESIYGRDPGLGEAIHLARRVSKSTSTVLILGESGTGKELFARAIHNESDRKERPFVPVNCAAIPEALLESELFGYEEGAFTGAVSGGRIGRFEQANRGTLFLDEIGDLPLHLQAKLLRVLQDHQVHKVGGRGGIPVDVRLITATNKPLEEMVRDGEFREDLFYRINVIPITVPPLRERMGDLDLLAMIFLEKHCKRLNKSMESISAEAMSIMKKYAWPGNVRELENAMEYAVHVAQGKVVSAGDLPRRLRIRDRQNGLKGKLGFSASEDHHDGIRPLDHLEKTEIERAVRVYGKAGSGIQAMTEALGISRATLYRKFKYYGI